MHHLLIVDECLACGALHSCRRRWTLLINRLHLELQALQIGNLIGHIVILLYAGIDGFFGTQFFLYDLRCHLCARRGNSWCCRLAFLSRFALIRLGILGGWRNIC